MTLAPVTTLSGIAVYQGRRATHARAGITVINHITRHWALLGAYCTNAMETASPKDP